MNRSHKFLLWTLLIVFFFICDQLLLPFKLFPHAFATLSDDEKELCTYFGQPVDDGFFSEFVKNIGKCPKPGDEAAEKTERDKCDKETDETKKKTCHDFLSLCKSFNVKIGDTAKNQRWMNWVISLISSLICILAVTSCALKHIFPSYVLLVMGGVFFLVTEFVLQFIIGETLDIAKYNLDVEIQDFVRCSKNKKDAGCDKIDVSYISMKTTISTNMKVLKAIKEKYFDLKIAFTATTISIFTVAIAAAIFEFYIDVISWGAVLTGWENASQCNPAGGALLFAVIVAAIATVTAAGGKKKLTDFDFDFKDPNSGGAFLVLLVGATIVLAIATLVINIKYPLFNHYLARGVLATILIALHSTNLAFLIDLRDGLKDKGRQYCAALVVVDKIVGTLNPLGPTAFPTPPTGPGPKPPAQGDGNRTYDTSKPPPKNELAKTLGNYGKNIPAKVQGGKKESKLQSVFDSEVVKGIEAGVGNAFDAWSKGDYEGGVKAMSNEKTQAALMGAFKMRDDLMNKYSDMKKKDPKLKDLNFYQDAKKVVDEMYAGIREEIQKQGGEEKFFSSQDKTFDLIDSLSSVKNKTDATPTPSPANTNTEIITNSNIQPPLPDIAVTPEEVDPLKNLLKKSEKEAKENKDAVTMEKTLAGHEWQVGQGIHNSPGESLFKLVELRYKVTGIPLLLRKKDK